MDVIRQLSPKLGLEPEVQNQQNVVDQAHAGARSREETGVLDVAGVDSMDEGLGPYFTTLQKKKKAEIKKGKMIAKEGFLEKEKSGGARGVFTG